MNNPENPIDSSADLTSDDTAPFRPDDSPSANGGGCIGRFRIERFHAAGGLGEVFEAHDTELHR